MSKNNELGKNGERIACDFLIKQGHRIIDTNYRFNHKEIDIISLWNDILIFSEIKTRSSLRYGYPEEAVTLVKQDFIKEAATEFLTTHSQYEKCRFDVISIVLKNDFKVVQIRHFEDAFF